jgi:Histidine kinase-, DNA gyrase B-, and HSP90-like ATPase
MTFPIRIMEPHTAAREVFTTSRLAEFCTRRELEKQTGYSAYDWPVYVVKELLDNALDASEEAQVAPRIAIEISADRITVADNGPGITAETVERLLDLSSRTSARSYYVSPTRGAQGQAPSTILVMSHALSPESGEAAVRIESRERAYRITVHVSKLTGEPRLVHEISDRSVKSGTKVTVEWPGSASPILEDAGPRFLPLAYAYALANPHLSLTIRTPGDEWTQEATEPDWTKWRACDPSSPFWYGPDKFGKLIAAYIQKDQETSRRRPLRGFLRLFDGLKGTTKRSRILAGLNLNRASLSDLARDGELDKSVIAALLHAMQAETKPVKPMRLGVIGEANLRIEGDGCKYVRKMGMDADGLPCVIEGAFAWRSRSKGGRLLITGANFASTPALSFKLSIWRDAGDVLTQRHAGPDLADNPTDPWEAAIRVVAGDREET